jgi:negative regulator of flagellin synthesis FlgM
MAALCRMSDCSFVMALAQVSLPTVEILAKAGGGPAHSSAKGHALKIDNSSKPVGKPQATQATTKKSGAGGAKRASSASSSSAEKVDITPLSAQLHALESKLEQVEVVDTARVEAIKQAIAEGRFRVNPDAIADRLIATVKEMVLSRKG